MMMSKEEPLSGAQALEDYFHALLDSSEDNYDNDEGITQSAPIAVSSTPVTMESIVDTPSPVYVDDHQVSKKNELGYLQPYSKAAAPLNTPINAVVKTVDVDEQAELDDVQRLLNQLENRNNFNSLPDLERIMEQNTLKLTKVNRSLRSATVSESRLKPEIVVTQNQAKTTQAIDDPKLQHTPQVVAKTEIHAEPIEIKTEIAANSIDSADACDERFGEWESAYRESEFQVLYFEVNNVTFAVPLDELGGIHRLAELNHLIGRPDWYLGLQSNKDQKLNVVDTALWVMSDKLTNDDYRAEYQYIVLLGDSSWGLACTKLAGTEWLTKEHIRWRTQPGKRPWLAGIIKEKMCVLIHVNAMTGMFNVGLDLKILEQ